ncbi:uncharacterized protein LOC129742824 [Uranotaenia lowii]|uniref:uncharacterized protein LOC129742674 n=1 Tax=Uranotaenia lowii TaxID=190385 RepID=UPI00247B0AAA|nr:uncharacterized protein LOC129742674 [Uranotaenia lowii]XP_055590739.1 uncharacterized protein LOC129742824 [Uranotaenia lowii]
MSPSPGAHPDRTIPEWMDPQGIHGRLYYMFLKAKKGFELPKNPFVIARSIEQYAGQIESGYFVKSKEWYVLKIRSKDQARKIFTMTTLIDGTEIELGRHPELNSRKFVVRCHEVAGMSEEELLKELSPQKILHVKRIMKKTSSGLVETPTLILTINSTVIPEFINFGFIRLRTRLYYPQPLICRHCLKYGHPKNKCLTEKVCIVCSGIHSSETCTAKSKFCANCKGNHSPLDRNCPVYTYETAVLKVKTEQNITLEAARRLVETHHQSITSYAEIVKNHNEVFMQQKKKQQPKKYIAPTEPKQQKDQQQQQQIQKRNHHSTESITPTTTVHLTVSPPRKRSTPQASPIASGDEAEDDQHQNDTLINSETRKLIKATNRVPSPNPSSSSQNLLQPPLNSKMKFDPRHNNACKK